MPTQHRPPADFSTPDLRAEVATLAGHLHTAEMEHLGAQVSSPARTGLAGG